VTKAEAEEAMKIGQSRGIRCWVEEVVKKSRQGWALDVATKRDFVEDPNVTEIGKKHLLTIEDAVDFLASDVVVDIGGK
jgi:hypothetical protein